MKASLLILLFVLSGCNISIDNRKGYEIGDCVRELGYEVVETVTAKADGGAIQTEYVSTNEYSKGKLRKQVYSRDRQEMLTKVKCN